MPIVEAMIQGFAFTTYAAPKPAMAKMPNKKQIAMTSLHGVGVLRSGLQVWVVRAQSRDGDRRVSVGEVLRLPRAAARGQLFLLHLDLHRLVRARPARGSRRSRAISDPVTDQGQEADAHQQRDEAFGDGTEPTETKAAGVVGVLNLGGDVLDDVVDLLVAQVAR